MAIISRDIRTLQVLCSKAKRAAKKKLGDERFERLCQNLSRATKSIDTLWQELHKREAVKKLTQDFKQLSIKTRAKLSNSEDIQAALKYLSLKKALEDTKQSLGSGATKSPFIRISEKVEEADALVYERKNPFYTAQSIQRAKKERALESESLIIDEDFLEAKSFIQNRLQMATYLNTAIEDSVTNFGCLVEELSHSTQKMRQAEEVSSEDFKTIWNLKMDLIKRYNQLVNTVKLCKGSFNEICTMLGIGEQKANFDNQKNAIDVDKNSEVLPNWWSSKSFLEDLKNLSLEGLKIEISVNEKIKSNDSKLTEGQQLIQNFDDQLPYNEKAFSALISFISEVEERIQNFLTQTKQIKKSQFYYFKTHAACLSVTLENYLKKIEEAHDQAINEKNRELASKHLDNKNELAQKLEDLTEATLDIINQERQKFPDNN